VGFKDGGYDYTDQIATFFIGTIYLSVWYMVDGNCCMDFHSIGMGTKYQHEYQQRWRESWSKPPMDLPSKEH
jgi:hypothetical protein